MWNYDIMIHRSNPVKKKRIEKYFLRAENYIVVLFSTLSDWFEIFHFYSPWQLALTFQDLIKITSSPAPAYFYIPALALILISKYGSIAGNILVQFSVIIQQIDKATTPVKLHHLPHPGDMGVTLFLPIYMYQATNWLQVITWGGSWLSLLSLLSFQAGYPGRPPLMS